MLSQGRKVSISSFKPPFQRCHRLQARLEALDAGLTELSLLRDRQERLVKEAMDSSHQKSKDAQDEALGLEEDEVAETLSAGDGCLDLRPGGYMNHRQQIAQNHSNESGKLEPRHQYETKEDAKSETPRRKSSGFFDGTDKHGPSAPQVSSVFGDTRSALQGYSDRSITTSGCVRENSLKQMTACNDSTKGVISVENSAARITDLKANLSLKTDFDPSKAHRTNERPRFTRSLSHQEPITTVDRSENVSLKTDFDQSNAHRTNGRPRFITRSLSHQEPIATADRSTANSMTREEMLRRKRRSVHEIDFSLGEHPELASQCYMGSSRAFRYPSPLHAISLQSALCLPGPEYDNNEQTT